jgi:hypothetical protein
VHVTDNGTPALYDEETITITVANLVDLAGRVFDDRDNDGVFEPSDGDVGLGGVPVEVWDQALTNRFAEAMTDDDGTYFLNANLQPGNYRIVEVLDELANGLLDGKETAGGLSGTVDNTQDSNVIAVTVEAGDPDAAGYNFAEILPSLLQALVWLDANSDGLVTFGESAIAGVTITLTGTDDRGTVNRVLATDSQGIA